MKVTDRPGAKNLGQDVEFDGGPRQSAHSTKLSYHID